MTRPHARVSAAREQRVTPRGGPDDFPTPPWAVRALLEKVHLGPGVTVWEPAANRGCMVRALRETEAEVIASDLHDYGRGWDRRDFLDKGAAAAVGPVDWVITNPPFALGRQFVLRALAQANQGVAMLARTAFLESRIRYALFREAPPSEIYVFVERPVMLSGRLADPDVAVIDAHGTRRKPSTATAYSWFVWRRDRHFLWPKAAPQLDWFEPGTRARLTLPGDYDIAAPGYADAPSAPARQNEAAA